VGQSYRRRSFPRACPLSLSRRPHLSAVSNLPPTISSPWTRPRPHVLRPRSSPRAPFERLALLAHLPSLICAPAELSRPLSCSARMNRDLRHCPPTLTACSMAAVAPVPRPVPRCASPYCQLLGTPFGVPSSPYCVWSALTGAFSCAAGVRHRRPVEPLRLYRCFATPALLLEVRNLPVPLLWSSSLDSSRDCSPEQPSAAVSPPRRGLRSPGAPASV
jgi:hypothetical protein